MSERKASDLFVECLEAEGVRYVFGIPGEETLDLNESLDRSSIEFVPVGATSPLVRALQAPIQLGPLPDGVHLTAITLRAGRATITGGGRAGRIRA